MKASLKNWNGTPEEMKEIDTKLQRDSCEECIAMKGQLNSNGEQMYCSRGHSAEPYEIKKEIAREKRIKELFDMVYQWGRVGIITDEDAPAFREIIDELVDTYY